MSGGGVRALPERLVLLLGVVSLLAALVLAVLGVVYAGSSVGTALDVGIRDELREVGAPWYQVALVVDWVGEPVGAAVVLGTLVAVFLRRGKRRRALLAVAGPAAAVAVTTVLKPLVGRTINDGFLSFPSGHTAAATAFALVVVLAGRVWLMAVVTVVAAVAMAWAQVLLNAHYPTDTVGGFCAALAVVPVVGWVVDWIGDRRSWF